MWTSASAATARSATANARPSRNALKPCFVDTSTGTRASRAAGSPWKSACTRWVWTIVGRAGGGRCGRVRENDERVASPARGGGARPGRRRSPSRVANSCAPGSSSCSITRRTSKPRSRSAGRRSSRWFSAPEMPATLTTWRTRTLIGRARRRARPRPRPSARGRRSPAVGCPTAFRSISRRRRIAAARPSTSPCAKRSSSGSRPSNAGFEATTGRHVAAASYTTLSVAPARMSLTSASTSAYRPGTAWRGAGPRMSTRSSSAELDHEALERDPVETLLLGQRRPDDEERARRRPRRPPGRSSRDPSPETFGRARAGSAARARAARRTARPRDVDAVTDRDELARAQRKRPLVDAQHASSRAAPPSRSTCSGASG